MTQTIQLPSREKAWPAPGEWTYQDYLALPDDGRRYEIIEGSLYVTNAPNIDHQFTVMEIAFQLKQFVNENESEAGYVITAPFEVHLSQETRPVQPDVLFIKSERWPGAGAAYFAGAPDLVVEVLSPSTSRTDQVIKFTAYEQAGVPEYWIANPKTQSVQVFTLSGREYALVDQFVGEDVIASQILPDLAIQADSLFQDIPTR
jgi:Uma2 family endonuclease